MEDTTVRRGRPPAAKTADADTTEDALVKRRRRASVGGHALKLQAPERAGFTRRWVNDRDNRLAQAQELAYDFVSDPDAQSSNIGSRISRLVGTKANGEPMTAYLMETPLEEYRAGVAEKEAVNSKIDEAIYAGRDHTGQLAPASEQYGQGSIKRDS